MRLWALDVMASPAAWIAIVAWANIVVVALWAWGDLFAYLAGAFHPAGGARGVLAVAALHLARTFVTIAAGLGSWERRRWARLWLLYASGWTLVVDAAMIHVQGASVWWQQSVFRLGPFGWLGAVSMSREVVATGTVVIFSLPAVGREFRAPGRWAPIAIGVVIACDLMFNAPGLWQNIRQWHVVAHARPEPG